MGRRSGDFGDSRQTSRLRGRSEDPEHRLRHLWEAGQPHAERALASSDGRGAFEGGLASLKSSPFAFRSAAQRSASSGPLAPESRPLQLKREVRSLLNKISPDNEVSIVSQLAALRLEGAEDFEQIAVLVIEKAINDPFYSEVYARAIRKLSMEYASLPLQPGEGSLAPPGRASFGETIVEQCRGTFDKFFGKAETLGDEEDDEEESAKLRHRAQAYVRLLGNLYVGRIICIDSLQHCINTLLLLSADEEDQETSCAWPPKAWIECACELLYTVGKDLSRSPEGRPILQEALMALGAWKDMRRPGHSTAGPQPALFPSRIQFLIQDVLEASKRGWPAGPSDNKGVPEKSKCKVPARAPQHLV